MQRPVAGETHRREPVLEYFIGMTEYGRYPFGASTLVAFRKQFSEEDLATILEASVPKAAEKKDNSDDGQDPPNSGTLILDATCCPADIAYQQNIDLLDQAREKAEKTVDELCEAIGQKKPRMCRKRARKDYLRPSKSKKCNAKAIRIAECNQLQYIRRDIGYVAKLVQKGVKLSSKQADHLNIVTTVYEQQRIMFESRTPSIPQRIVSLFQPWVRPSLGQAAKRFAFAPPGKEARVLGQLRPQRCGGRFRDGQDRLWSSTHYGSPAGTYVCVIGVALLFLNLSRPLRAALALFCLLVVLTILQGVRSRAYINILSENLLVSSQVDWEQMQSYDCQYPSVDFVERSLSEQHFCGTTNKSALIACEIYRKYQLKIRDAKPASRVKFKSRHFSPVYLPEVAIPQATHSSVRCKSSFQDLNQIAELRFPYHLSQAVDCCVALGI